MAHSNSRAAGRCSAPGPAAGREKGPKLSWSPMGWRGILHLEKTLDPEQAESKWVPKMSKTKSRLSVTSEGLCETTSSSLGGKEPKVSK